MGPSSSSWTLPVPRLAGREAVTGEPSCAAALGQCRPLFRRSVLVVAPAKRGGWEALRLARAEGASVTALWSGKRRTASMMPMQKEWGDVPPCWMVYFAVADCDATAARAAQAGGRVIVEPLSIPTAGRLALLVDPGGALFGALQLGAPAK